MKRIIYNRHLIRAGLFLLILAYTTSSFGQVSTLQNWTNLYHGTSTTQQNLTYTLPAGSNSTRVLVVAIASARTTTGTRTVTLTYGGQALTLAAGDMGQTLYQHTALYYLNEAGLDAATNTTLAVTVSNGTTRITDVFAAVFDNVDQSGPITNSRNYYSAGTQTTFTYSPGLNINAQDLAIEVVSSDRVGVATSRTVTTYPTNWALSTQQTWANTDGIRNMIISRSLPTSDVTDVASITMSGTSYPSMTALSLNSMPLIYYTLSAGNDGNGTVALDPSGGTYLNGTTVTLTPVPNPGYGFSGWTGANAGDIINTGGVYTIVMNEAKSVTATFEQIPVVLTDGTASSGTGNANATSVSLSHTTGSGNNRLMLVGVSWNCATTNRTISSVTFSYGTGPTVVNGTEVITQLAYSTSNPRYSAIYRFPNPPSGVTGTLTVTFSGAVSNGIVAGAINFSGVNQTTPLGTPVGAAGNSATPSVQLTGLGGTELIFDNVFQGAQSSSQTLTTGAGQTERWNSYISSVRAAASTEQATGSSVTMSWTAGSSSYWAITAVPINPAPIDDYTLTVGTVGNGTVSLDPEGGTYTSGTTVTLTPVPNTGYVFSNWSGTDAGDIINTGGVYTIVMDENKSVTANFSQLATGSATSTVTPSDATPRIGDQITATVYIDMSGVNAPDNYLGSYTGTLNWNPAVLSYASHTGHPPSGFIGSVNTANAATGAITFNGANIDGATGNILMMTITFNVVGSGNSALDLAYSAMAATPTTRSLLPILTVTDGQVVVAGPPTCGVVIDGAASSGTGAPATGSVSFSHTTGTGTDRLMLVGVSWNCGTADRTITSVTFTPGGGGATSLTEVITYNGYNTANPRYSAIYRYVNPPSGVTGTITITFSGNVSNGIAAGAANFAGVNQATPLGTAVSAGSGTTQQTTATVDVPTPNGNELVFDNLFIGYSSGQTITVGSGQSQLWNINNTATNFNTVGAASTEQTTGSSVTMSWSATTAAYYSLTAVPVNPSTTSTTWLGTTSNAWNEATNWCFGVPTSATDVTITAYPVNQPVIPATVTASANNVTINPGATLTIEPQGTVTFGSLANNGTLNLESDIDGMFSLMINGAYSGTGNVKSEICMTGGEAGTDMWRWHYFAVPSQQSSAYLAGEYGDNIMKYDDAASLTDISEGWNWWAGYDGTTAFTNLVPTEGYAFYHPNAVTPLTMELNGASLLTTLGIKNLNFSSAFGWNLIGNSLTCGLNWDNVTFNGGVDYSVCFIKDFVEYYYIKDGPGSPLNGYNGHIPPLQGFFVQAASSGASIDFSSAKEHNDTPYYKKGNAGSSDEKSFPILRLTLGKDNLTDETVIWFNENATLDFDSRFDAEKWLSEGTRPQLYSVLSDKEYAINGIPFPETSVEIPLAFSVPEEGTYSIKQIELRDEGKYDIFLKDRLTGNQVRLNETDTYTFSASEGTVENRFIISIVSIATGTDDMKIKETEFNVYESFGFINIELLDEAWEGREGKVKIVDITGMTLADLRNQSFSRSSLIRIPMAGRKGVFIVEISSYPMRNISKVVLK